MTDVLLGKHTDTKNSRDSRENENQYPGTLSRTNASPRLELGSTSFLSMAADVALDFDASNRCCAKLKKKFLKLEASRNALRQAVHILNQQVDKLEGENANLQKVCQQHEDLESGKKEKEEQPGIILKLEKEIYDLKAEITAYRQQETKAHGKMPDVCLSERDVEIKLLKEELVKEKERGDNEKKRAEVEKKKAAEGRKLLETEQRKAQEQRKLAETERKKDEGLKLSLERLRTELTDANTKIMTEKKLLETEKKKAEEQKKLAVTEQKKAEELKLSLERLRTELTDTKTKLMTERAKTHELDKSIEAEKLKTIMEKNHADFEKSKSKELSSSLEAQCIEAREQKINAERMKQMLEDRNKIIEDLETKLYKVMSNLRSAHDKKMKLGSSNEVGIIRSLKQQLKFEKKRVKHAKRMVKLEKAEKMVIAQQIHLVQQDFMQLSCHLKMLGDQLCHRNEGTHGFAKVDGSDLKLNLRSALHCSESDLLQGKLYKGSPSCPGSGRKCSHFDVSGGQCVRSIAGTQFALSKQQNSTVCSTSATCSDMMSLQGIDAVFLATRNTQNKMPVDEEYKVTDRVFFVNGKKREKQELLGLDNWFCYKDKHFHKDPLPSVSEGNKDSDNVEVHVGSKKRKKRDPVALDKSSCHKNTGFHKDPLRSVSEGKKATGSIVDASGKKTRKQDPLALDKSLCDKDKQFHIGKTEELPTGRNLMRNPVGLAKPNSHAKNGIPKTSNNWRGQLTEIHDGTCGKFQGSLKNSKDKPKTSCLKCFNPGQMHQSENNYSMGPCIANKSSSMSLIMKEVNPSTREKDIGAISDNQANFVCSKNINLQDYMTLLMLDNEDDERRYMEAIERPVSPTLPEIKISNGVYGGRDQSHCFVDSIFRKPLAEVTCEPCRYFDVIDLEINSNKLELLTPNPPVPKDAIGVIHASEDSEPDSVLESQRDLNKNEIQPLVSKCTQGVVHASEESEPNRALIVQRDLHNTEPLDKSVQKFDHGTTMSLAVGKIFCDRVVNVSANTVAGQSLMSDDFLGAGKIDDNQVSNSNVVARSDSCVHLSASQEAQNPHGNSASLENTTWCCVVFSDCKDESISRIVQARNIVASQNFRSFQVDCSIVEVLQSLKSLLELQSEEKVCVFFSLMLGNISGRLHAYPGSMMASNILQFAKSLSEEIDKVFSDATACQLFLEVCNIDMLLNLLEDFLVKRRILMRKGVESEQSCLLLSSNFLHAKCGDMSVTQNAAKTNQLLAASIFCASICSMLDQIGFLIETSYKVLRYFKCDTSLNLLILHVFALVSGEKFFAMEKYNFLAIVLKSVISLLEEGYQTPPSDHLTSDVDICFSPCKQCPFSKEIVCAEKITSSLMDILHDFTFSGNSSTSSIFPLSLETIAENSHGAEESIHCSREHDKSNQCESSCVLYQYGYHADQTSSSTPERVTEYAPMKPLCYIIDVVSAIELFSLYMGWKWTSDNILPQILAMLKLRPSTKFSAAAVVLIGQLGRLGVDYGGYQEIGVSQLRCNLSSLLKASLQGKNSLPNQLAIINALVNLLPLSFKEIVDINHEHLVDADQSQEIKVVKEWFAQLDKKMQVMVLNFSGHAV